MSVTFAKSELNVDRAVYNRGAAIVCIGISLPAVTLIWVNGPPDEQRKGN